MNIKALLCAILGTVICVASTAHAMDVGILAPTEQKFRTEVYYENYERDLKLEGRFGTGSGGGTQEEERVLARFSFSPQRSWGVSFEVGGADAEGSEDIAPIIGVGAHVVVLDKGAFYASLFGKITWVTGIEYRERWWESTNGSDYEIRAYHRDEDYIEYALGLQVGHQWTPCAWAEVTSYAGAMASFIDDTKSEDRIYMERFFEGMAQPETFSARESNLYMEEEHIFQAVVGVATTITPYNIGVRVEGRFYDRTSISGSLFWNF